MTTPTTRHAPRHGKRPAPPRAAAPSSAPENTDTPVSSSSSFLEPERRNAMISDAAYFLAEQRDFCPGHEFEDWVTAEREIDRQLSSGPPGIGFGT